MKATVMRWSGAAWRALDGAPAPAAADLVLWFAAPSLAKDPDLYDALRRNFPVAVIAGCSTGGEIIGNEASDQSAVAAVVSFTHARVRGMRADVAPGGSITDLGARLARTLAAPDLKGVYVLSDGVMVNGTALVDGLTSVLPRDVVVTGGLAGDGADFQQTRVGLDAPLSPSAVVAVGFYSYGEICPHGFTGACTLHNQTMTVTLVREAA